MKKNLPENYSIRPFSLAEAEPAVELFNAHSMRVLGVEQDTVEDMLVEWKSDPEFKPEEDAILVYDPQQRTVGYVDLWGAHPPYARMYSFGVVHPDHLGRGIGGFMLDWLEEKAHLVIPKAEPDIKLSLLQYINEQDHEAADLFTGAGWDHVRRFWRMSIEMEDEIAEPEIAAGFTIRPFNPTDEEYRATVMVVFTSFQDHYGFVNEPFEAYYERFINMVKVNPDHDPSLWYLAIYGDKIAGVCLCHPKIVEDLDMGWVSTLGVLPEYRKHGLGYSLLRHSFREFHLRGKKRVALGVDSSSLTGATRLYERAGMHVVRVHNLYEKVLRPGRDISTQTMAE